jgi:hypothetical protein
VRRITGLAPKPKKDKLEGSRFVCVPREQDPVYTAGTLGLEGELRVGEPVAPYSRRFGGKLETAEQLVEWDEQLDEWEEQSSTRREAWLARREGKKYWLFLQSLVKRAA